jgi:hypothetical protein
MSALPTDEITDTRRIDALEAVIRRYGYWTESHSETSLRQRLDALVRLAASEAEGADA